MTLICCDAYGRRSTCHYRRSGSPTFARYLDGMRKAACVSPRREGDQITKTVADARNEIALAAEAALPPKKPPAPLEASLAEDEGAEIEVSARRDFVNQKETVLCQRRSKHLHLQ